MRILLRRKLVVLPILLLTVLAWSGHHLSTSYSCAQARSAKVAKRNARAAQLRSLQADTSRLSVELEMLARSDHIQEVCRNYQLREDDNQDCGYRSKDQSFDQNIENHFLADPRTGTVYCFIHKVGFFSSIHLCSVFCHAGGLQHLDVSLCQAGEQHEVSQASGEGWKLLSGR